MPDCQGFGSKFFLKWIHTDCKTAQGTPLAAAEWKKTNPHRAAAQRAAGAHTEPLFSSRIKALRPKGPAAC